MNADKVYGNYLEAIKMNGMHEMATSVWRN